MILTFKCLSYSLYKTWILIFLLCSVPVFTYAQTVLDANFGDINFGGPGVTITAKEGNGTGEGDIVLYENVINIGGTQVDAIIRTIELNNGDMDTFDAKGTSGALQNNQQRFFSPLFDFEDGGGSCEFHIEFIEGGSYDTSTHTGTLVILENVYANTYDIDGNGGDGTNQFNEYGGFSSITLGDPTDIEISYNTSTSLTQFRSNTDDNIDDVLDDATRVRVTYDQLSVMTFIVGASDDGPAYFFIDFSDGPPWADSTVYIPPNIILDPEGTHNVDTFCEIPVPFTRGDTSHIAADNLPVDEFIISFETSDILDGASENILINSADAGSPIALNFTHGFAVDNVELNGITYAVEATVIDGQSTLRFSNDNATTFTLAQAEELLDSLHYYNSDPSSGVRTFNIFVRQEALTSPPTQFIVYVDCSLLPVSNLLLDAEILNSKTIRLHWSTTSEYNNHYFDIQRSLELKTWESLGSISGMGNSYETNSYEYIDYHAIPGLLYYRLVQVDYKGKTSLSNILMIKNYNFKTELDLYPNPVSRELNIESPMINHQEPINIYNAYGQNINPDKIQYIDNHLIRLDLSSLHSGLYYIQGKNWHRSFIVRH